MILFVIRQHNFMLLISKKYKKNQKNNINFYYRLKNNFILKSKIDNNYIKNIKKLVNKKYKNQKNKTIQN